MDFRAQIKKRDAAAVAKARKMHKECMQDPEYALRWTALVLAIGHLADLPADALDVPTDQ